MPKAGPSFGDGFWICARLCFLTDLSSFCGFFTSRFQQGWGAENRKMLGAFFCITKTRFTQDRFVHRTVSEAQIYTLEVPGSGTKRQLAVDLVSTRRVACGRERWPGASRNSNSVTAGISQACTLKRWCQNHCDLPQNTPVFVVFPPWCQQTRCYFQYSLVRMMVLVQKTLATCCFPQSPPYVKNTMRWWQRDDVFAEASSSYTPFINRNKKKVKPDMW